MFFSRLGRSIALALLLVTASTASPQDEEKAPPALASRFSARWQAIQSEIARIDSQLATLPSIPLRDYQGPAGYAQLITASDSQEESHEVSIDILWNAPARIDLVALVPARNYSIAGLDPQFGLPQDFSVALLDEHGNPLPPFARESNLENDPVRSGHPFLYSLPDPVVATGLRIHATRISRSAYGPGTAEIFALAEAFCFAGEVNVARDAEVLIEASAKTSPLHLWDPKFLVDETTPLGFAELPADPTSPWPDIGWISSAFVSPLSRAWVQLDLGEPRRFNAFRMFPALRPTLTSIPGFGMPGRYNLAVSDTGLPGSWKIIVNNDTGTIPNPGHNPRTDRFPPTTARFIRLHATQLWKSLPNYPAFLGFSELQVLHDQQEVAPIAAVEVSHSPDRVRAHEFRFWSTSSLTDGFGPEGKLVSTRQWLTLLDERLALERQQHKLTREADAIASAWHRGTIATLAVAAVLGTLASLILPLRFRRLERHKLRTIRQRLAGDLHDDIGSNLGTIQLLAEMARSNPDQRNHLKSIQQVAAETVTSVRDIVWLLRPSEANRLPTVSHLRESATILLSALEWSLTSDFDEENLQLSDEQQRNLSLFFREALHNLVRHSEATKVNIHLSRSSSSLTMEISDNGTGVAEETANKPTFLRALKQRATRLEGALSIKTSPGKGTSLRLSVPLLG